MTQHEIYKYLKNQTSAKSNKNIRTNLQILQSSTTVSLNKLEKSGFIKSVLIKDQKTGKLIKHYYTKTE